VNQPHLNSSHVAGDPLLVCGQRVNDLTLHSSQTARLIANGAAFPWPDESRGVIANHLPAIRCSDALNVGAALFASLDG